MQGTSKSSTKPHFVIQFLEAIDCPSAIDYRQKSNLYIRSLVWQYITKEGKGGAPPVCKPECISEIVTTHIRLDCRAAVWNSYRDFRVSPPDDAVLLVQIYHATTDSPKPELDILLGKVEIPLSLLRTEEQLTQRMIPIRNSDRLQCPNFSIKLRRAFVSSLPPKRKTFFLIRHGESKWNEAQSKINIAGMLDRDHPLTDLGISQAQSLNERWRRHFAEASRAPVTVLSNVAKAIASQPASAATADLLDLSSFEDPPIVAPSGGVIDFTGDGFPDDPFADVQQLSLQPSAPALPNEDVWSKDDLTQHLNRLSASINVVDEDFCANAFDSDSDDDGETAGKSGSTNKQQVASAGSSNSADVFARTQNKATSLVQKFNDSEVKLVDDLNGTVDAELVKQRSDEYMNLFIHADAIYSSPLTRALQTAVLSMDGHPATKAGGITLYSVIREVKRMGGLDTVGVAIGENIELRLRTELASMIGREKTDAAISFPIDFNDTFQPWWTPLADHETEAEQQARVREFLTFLRYCDAQIPVFVGHSLFFKAFYSKRVSSRLLKNRQQLSENLKKFKLSNASMLAVTVNFTDFSMGGGLSEAIMIDADIIFGGGFHGAEARKDGKSRNGNGSRSKGQTASGPSAASVGKEIFGMVNPFSADVQQNLQKELENGRQAVSKNIKKWSSAMKDFLDS